MRRLPAALLPLLLCLPPLAAHEISSPAFSGAEISPVGLLRLTAAEPYLDLKGPERRAAVETAAAPYPAAGFAVVEHKGNGELWTISQSSAALADTWSRKELRFTRRARTAGRWFGHISGQFARGGDYPSNGWTARLGTTLYDNRYDAAVSLSRNTFTDIDGSGVTTFGLTGRALYPYTRHAGLNLGLQLDRVSASGYSDFSPSATGGVNIYLPGGSFDMSLTYGAKGRVSLLAGYTVYIGR
ncbi:MAG: hypothetical protein FD189_2286 [Elusimicrobia bacterium]|nr:MAG: hypothetical protein FD154_2254 [Elusimicrobiota bacterium]KAF0153777.1 MAG: hypothetical protein FD189_2286 [Elusimicrobiota bacterium]